MKHLVRCTAIFICLFSALQVRADDGISSDLANALRQTGTSLGNPVYIRVIKRPQQEFNQNSNIQDSFDPHPAKMPDPDMFSYAYPSGLGDDQWEHNKANGQITKFSRDVGQMEIWIRSSSGQYVLLKTYPVAAYSGPLGPKTKPEDFQTPEGFYKITPDEMKPESAYVKAMDIGHPNAYDIAHFHFNPSYHSLVEIHGSDVTKACLAMDDNIKDIYALVAAAQKAGQEQVPVHIFPFPLTNQNLAKIPDSPIKQFWEKLQPGYMDFQATHLPPTIGFDRNGEYVVSFPLPVAGPINHIQNVGRPPCAACSVQQ